MKLLHSYKKGSLFYSDIDTWYWIWYGIISERHCWVKKAGCRIGNRACYHLCVFKRGEGEYIYQIHYLIVYLWKTSGTSNWLPLEKRTRWIETEFRGKTFHCILICRFVRTLGEAGSLIVFDLLTLY